MGGTNGGITTLESAAAYAIFGNGGRYYEPKLYYKVCDQRGEEILSNETPSPTVAIGEDTATVMNHLLRNVVYGANGTGGAAGKYVPGMTIYAKTGTSNNSNDLWFVGGTPYYISSCWCGYDKQTGISDQGIALKMWGAVAQKIHSGLTAKEFSDSAYAVDRYYCKSTGLLATENCTDKAIGWYKKNGLPGVCKTHGGEALKSPAELKAEEEKKIAEQAAQAAADGTASSQN